MPEIPAPEDTIEAKFNALLERVKKLETADPLQNAVIHKGGIVIQEGGSVKVVDSNGNIVAIIGALPAFYNRADGSPQPGLALYREDGTPAVLLGDTNAAVPPFLQSFQIFDRQASVVVADDTNGGIGLARPYVPMGFWVDNLASGSAATPTTSATYVIQQIAFVFSQHPVIRVDVIANSTSAGTTGAIGLFNPAGVQVGADMTVPANAVSYLTLVTAQPTGWSITDNGNWTLRAKRTAGTGAIGVRGTGFWGKQS